ncbi:hypothetical protein AB0C70_38330 [Streptomyces sp. NPDC048564]|uniref:hypothetical protein n=1 Tax=Streptomyces sp. NPDC048564 TaxID=3155760 RepID=UPI00343C4851
MGRSIQDLISIVSGLRKRGIGFQSLHESLAAQYGRRRKWQSSAIRRTAWAPSRTCCKNS